MGSCKNYVQYSNNTLWYDTIRYAIRYDYIWIRYVYIWIGKKLGQLPGHSLDLSVDFTVGGTRRKILEARERPTTTTLLTWVPSFFENQNEAIYPGGHPSNYNHVRLGLTFYSVVKGDAIADCYNIFFFSSDLSFSLVMTKMKIPRELFEAKKTSGNFF